MLTSKQRAYLRGMANNLEPIFQVGKGGIGENMVKQFSDALEARELIKVHVLQNALAETRAISEEIAEKTGADVVQVIGSKIVLYRESREKSSIILP